MSTRVLLQRTGILLINLGTPTAPETSAVRDYLKQFLMDPYVLDTPWPIRKVIVSGFILPFRPKRSAQAYAKIWSKLGSPLLLQSQALRSALAQRLNLPVALGMRYGEPCIATAVAELKAHKVNNIVVAPLYPQFADATVTTSIEAFKRQLSDDITWQVVAPFYDNPGYIEALAERCKKSLPSQWDHLLLSYHGLPERHLTRTDPTNSHCLSGENCCHQPSTAHATCYRHQALTTSALLAQKLSLTKQQFTVSYQSRLGRLPWLRPYTDQVLAEFPNQGIKHLVVACPAFIADNLETLEELGMRGRDTFLAAGGKTFHLIPCLNDDSAWVRALSNLVKNQIATASLETSL